MDAPSIARDNTECTTLTAKTNVPGGPLKDILSDIHSFLSNPKQAFHRMSPFPADNFPFSPCSMFTLAIKWDTFLEVEPLLDDIPGRRNSRISYFDKEMVVQYIPTRAHESAHQEIQMAIRVTLQSLNATGEDFLVSLGTSRETNSANGVSLEGDTALAPEPVSPNTGLQPTLVIECGDLQSYPSLLRKADAWLLNFPSVLAVIVINVHQDISQTVEMEVWERALAPPGRALAGRSRLGSSWCNNIHYPCTEDAGMVPQTVLFFIVVIFLE
ncbi:hypothetical protein FB451DRAFT_1523377 [Mycena latifolia]|nr:hypothetical protein FB451DRAFT_1523377 [Mycena latifolia]